MAVVRRGLVRRHAAPAGRATTTARCARRGQRRRAIRVRQPVVVPVPAAGHGPAAVIQVQGRGADLRATAAGLPPDQRPGARRLLRRPRRRASAGEPRHRPTLLLPQAQVGRTPGAHHRHSATGLLRQPRRARRAAGACAAAAAGVGARRQPDLPLERRDALVGHLLFVLPELALPLEVLLQALALQLQRLEVRLLLLQLLLQRLHLAPQLLLLRPRGVGVGVAASGRQSGGRRGAAQPLQLLLLLLVLLPEALQLLLQLLHLVLVLLLALVRLLLPLLLGALQLLPGVLELLLELSRLGGPGGALLLQLRAGGQRCLLAGSLRLLLGVPHLLPQLLGVPRMLLLQVLLRLLRARRCR